MKQLRILVTGADGRIGRRLVPVLVSRGHEVIAVARQERSFGPGVEAIPGDLMDSRIRNLAFESLAGSDKTGTVLHLAAFNGSSETERLHPSEFFGNVDLTQRVLESAATSGIPRFVFASTGLVYGTNRVAPCEETDATDPPSYYAATKLACEILIRARTRQSGTSSDILRLGNVFGPDSPESTAAGRIFGQIRRKQPVSVFSPQSIRDFIFITDAVEAMVVVLESVPEGPGTVLNVGTGAGTTVHELATAAAAVAGTSGVVASSQRRPKDVLVLSSARLNARTGWKARFTLEQAVRECVLA